MSIPSQKPLDDNFWDKVVCGDSLEVLKTLPDSSVHLLLSDIPYGIGAEDWDVLHDNTNSAYLGSSPTIKMKITQAGAAGAKTTITCVKGNKAKKVTALKPVCPAGFKKK